MKRAVITLMLLAGSTSAAPVPHALAEDPTLGKRVDNTKDAVTHAATDAHERATAAAEQAKERAGEVAEQAQERAHEAADSLSERAREVAAHAEELAGLLVENAKAKAEQLGERATGFVEQGKSAAGDAMQGARDQARAILMGAAVALDNKSKEARQSARRASWEKLKTRFSLQGSRPSLVLSEELRDHEYRVARLRRARELASAVGDESSTAQSDKLLEQEYGRHKRRIEEIEKKERDEAQR